MSICYHYGTWSDSKVTCFVSECAGYLNHRFQDKVYHEAYVHGSSVISRYWRRTSCRFDKCRRKHVLTRSPKCLPRPEQRSKGHLVCAFHHGFWWVTSQQLTKWRVEKFKIESLCARLYFRIPASFFGVCVCVFYVVVVVTLFPTENNKQHTWIRTLHL